MILYKYTTYSENLLSNLARDKIWVSTPDRFNDLFDCQYTINRKLSESEIKELHALAEHRKQSGDVNDLLVTACDTGNLGDMANEIADKLEENLRSKVGLYCLSEICDSLLMWSHYADMHRGLCLGFKAKPGIISNSLGLYPVNYSSHFPTIRLKDFLFGLDLPAKQVLFTKSSEWSYEKEWRLMTTPSNAEIDSPFKLKTIIFGANMSQVHADTIKAILKDRQEIQYKRARPNDSAFSLDFDNY